MEETVTGNRRLDWDDYYLRIADDVALRADCTRRKVGAVLVAKDNRIVSTGYNGSPPGKPGCLSDGACPRGRHYKKVKWIDEGPFEIALGKQETCACGSAWPCAKAVKPGSSYDTGAGACIALHAEQNCLLRAGTSAAGGTLYITDEPCGGCRKLIEGAGVARVVWYDGSWALREESLNAIRKLLRWRWWF